MFLAKLVDKEKLTVMFLREQEEGKFVFPQQDDVPDVHANEKVGRARATKRRGVFAFPKNVIALATDMAGM